MIQGLTPFLVPCRLHKSPKSFWGEGAGAKGTSGKSLVDSQRDPWHVYSFTLPQEGEAPFEHPLKLIQCSQDCHGAEYEPGGPPSSTGSAATRPQV